MNQGPVARASCFSTTSKKFVIMKSVRCFIIGLLAFCFLQLQAQHQNGTAAEKKDGRQLNTAAGNRQENNGVNALDTASSKKSAGAESSTNGKAEQSGNTSNTPGLIERTSSPSGSPALLSSGKGSQRDGTNNVQRATMNMAGAPASNLQLTRQQVDVNNEIQRGRSNVDTRSRNPRSNRINNKTRKENNDLSDQNRSSKNKGSKIMQENTKKSRKRNKG